MSDGRSSGTGGAPRGASTNKRSRSGRPKRHSAPPGPTVRRLGRERGLKVNQIAAKHLRAGHPWIFSDSLLRPMEGAPTGACVRVVDPDGFALGWGLVDADGAIAARIVSLETEDFAWDAEEIHRRVGRAKHFRERLLEPEIHTACRVVHGEGDGLPGVAVDRLGDFLLVYKYAKIAESYMDDLVAALVAHHQPEGIYLQDRLRPVTPDERRGGATLLHGKVAPTEIPIQEDGLTFLVDVTAPVSPGLFLDLREGRRWCERLSPGKRVLNLFSFTGAFGMRAVRAGATSVVNVDAAAKAHARCRGNLTAAGLDPESCQGLVGDVFKHLERMRRNGERFDLVVVDPPPFSRVKDRVFSALRDWQELLSAIAGVVDDDGLVMAVSNAGKLREDELMGAIGEGALAGGRTARLIGETGLPPDFPVPPAFAEGRYLKVKLLHLS